jgi:hypothetical protein
MYKHTLTIETEQPVDEKGVEAFLDACGYLLTGFIGADAKLHATWNGTGEVVTEAQIKRFGPMESLGAVDGESVTV